MTPPKGKSGKTVNKKQRGKARNSSKPSKKVTKTENMDNKTVWKNNFRASFLETLIKKKNELGEALLRLRGSQKEYDGELHAGDFIDEIDDAQREISAHQIYSLLERKDRELRNVVRLIHRIQKEDDFGFCEECGDRIPRERLLVIPEATLCVPCQREMERLDQTMHFSAGGYKSRKPIEWVSSEDSDDEDSLLSEYRIGDYPGGDDDEADFDESPDDGK